MTQPLLAAQPQPSFFQFKDTSASMLNLSAITIISAQKGGSPASFWLQVFCGNCVATSSIRLCVRENGTLRTVVLAYDGEWLRNDDFTEIQKIFQKAADNLPETEEGES